MLNFLLRFFWTLTLIPEGGEEAWQKTIQVRLSPVLAAAEICRRCMWAFLRLENEHLHTYGTAIDDGFTALDEAELMALGPHAMEPMHVATGEILAIGMKYLVRQDQAFRVIRIWRTKMQGTTNERLSVTMQKLERTPNMRKMMTRKK